MPSVAQNFRSVFWFSHCDPVSRERWKWRLRFWLWYSSKGFSKSSLVAEILFSFFTNTVANRQSKDWRNRKIKGQFERSNFHNRKRYLSRMECPALVAKSKVSVAMALFPSVDSSVTYHPQEIDPLSLGKFDCAALDTLLLGCSLWKLTSGSNSKQCRHPQNVRALDFGWAWRNKIHILTMKHLVRGFCRSTLSESELRILCFVRLIFERSVWRIAAVTYNWCCRDGTLLHCFITTFLQFIVSCDHILWFSQCSVRKNSIDGGALLVFYLVLCSSNVKE